MTSGALTDPACRTFIAPAFETITNRRVTVGMGSRRFYIGVQSSSYRRLAGTRSGPDAGYEGSALWRSMGYVGCASLALCLVFAAGGVLRASPPLSGYAVVMPIDGKATPVATPQSTKPHRMARARGIAKAISPAIMNSTADLSADPVIDVGAGSDAGLSSTPDVKPLSTANGERAVAVYGPLRQVAGKSCRDVQIFVRGSNGLISVSPTTECRAAR